MGELSIGHVVELAEDYGSGDRARLFTLIHGICELELGVTMHDRAITSWYNPNQRYTPSFRLLNLNRTLREDRTFRVNSFIFDQPGDMTVGFEAGAQDDPFMPYVSDILAQSVAAHDHKPCEEEKISAAVEPVAYRDRIYRRMLDNVWSRIPSLK